MVVVDLEMVGETENVSPIEVEALEHIAGLVIPVFQRELPALNHLGHLDIEGFGTGLYPRKTVQLYGEPPKRRKMTPALNIVLFSSRVGVSIGKMRLDLSGQPLEFRQEYGGGGGHFSKGNLAEAEKAAQSAVTQTLATFIQKPEDRNMWRIKELNFGSLLKRLGLTEEGELVFLRDKVIYDLIKKQAPVGDLSKYQQAVERAMNQQESVTTAVIKIGLIIAQAKMYHSAGYPQKALDKSLEAIVFAEESGHKNIAGVISAISEERFIPWDDIDKS